MVLPLVLSLVLSFVLSLVLSFWCFPVVLLSCWVVLPECVVLGCHIHGELFFLSIVACSLSQFC